MLIQKKWECNIERDKPYSAVRDKGGDFLRLTYMSLTSSPLYRKTSVYAKIGEEVYMLANLVARVYGFQGYEEVKINNIFLKPSDKVILYTEGPGVVHIGGYEYFNPAWQDWEMFEQVILQEINIGWAEEKTDNESFGNEGEAAGFCLDEILEDEDEDVDEGTDDAENPKFEEVDNKVFYENGQKIYYSIILFIL